MIRKAKDWLKQFPVFIRLASTLRRYGRRKNSYRDIRLMLEEKDRLNAIEKPELLPLHNKLNELRDLQNKKWGSYIYCDGYFYQGYGKIGINGIKPTEDRLSNYEIEEYFDKNKTCLDIGSNSGFLSCYLADKVKSVDGIELNEYLVRMGIATKDFLRLGNVNFIEGNFIHYEFKKKYDLCFSLSNHFTIDGNLNANFESYVSKIFDLMNEGGILFFESHSIYSGDKDLDEKFLVASKYFHLEKFKMVKAFYKPDIDKLFAVFSKRATKAETGSTNFELAKARLKYEY